MRTFPIAVAEGDGIGPEITHAVLTILEASGAPLDIRRVAVGEKVYRAGETSGVSPEAWAQMRECGILLKGPITTPQGGGYKSVNVTLRKSLGLYANVRPCRTYTPFVPSHHPDMDLVIVRENEEDLYAGIEHRQTDEVFQCLKLVSRQGCERIVRYAFEFARTHGRRRVSCLVKDNIMKCTDGLFHRVFDEIGQEYPGIEKEVLLVDIGAAWLADTPERFDVLVMPNLYGDILSDVAAQITGSVGLGGSANIGPTVAMFEAIHGSAPAIAGRNEANPSGMLTAALMMLRHLGLHEQATTIENAWLKSLEDGYHTPDVRSPLTRHPVGTQGFAEAIVARLGQVPSSLKPVQSLPPAPMQLTPPASRPPCVKRLVGVDLFLHWRDGAPTLLGSTLSRCNDSRLQLKVITNRGVRVWPNGLPETLCVDHWRCRFMEAEGQLDYGDVISLMQRAHDNGFNVIKSENLYDFDGEPGYSAIHG